MKLLVYGAGVLGSLYAAKLRQDGHDVSILARGQRLADLQAAGIVLQDARTGVRTTTPIEVVDQLEPGDAYDIVLVIVRKDQLSSVLPVVGANRGTPTVLFMVNNASGPDALIQAVGRERVLLGFAGAGGTRQTDAIHYHILPAWQQATTLGELDGKQSPRLEQIAAAFRRAGFPVAISTRMDNWLITHVVWTCAGAHALYLVGGSNYALARTRDALVLWIRAVREGYRAMRNLGKPITPGGLRIFEVAREPILVPFLSRLLDTPTAELVIARHANAARAEYVQLGEEYRALAKLAGVPTPAFDLLRPYVDPAVPPIQEGRAELPLRW
jgi:2-dehydropantoate 2-reductase